MQRTMQKSEELYIENPRLDHKLCQDLINYDIIYIQASLGWGKYTFLSHFSGHHPEYTIQMLDIYNIDQQLSELPAKDGQILLIPRYEKLQDSEEKEQIVETDPEAGAQRKVCLCIHDPVAGGASGIQGFRSFAHLWDKRIKTGKERSRQLFLQKRNPSLSGGTGTDRA